MLCTVQYDIFVNHPGAGIYASRRTSSSQFNPRSIANNSLIVSASNGLRLLCVSNSSQSGVGMITGLDGNTLPIGTGDLRILRLSRPGSLRIQTRFTSSLPAADQGIYTCTIPDSNDNQISINVGLYPHGFMGELYMEDTSVILAQVLL